MKKLIVNYCGNCPFCYSNYDGFATGYSTLDICTLSRFLNHESIISKHNNSGFNEESKTPDWCPLKSENYGLSFREYSHEKLKEIDSIKNQIKELEDYYDENNSYEEKQNNETLISLYKKLDDLQKLPEDYLSDLKDDVEFTVDEIKDQLYSIQDASFRLQEAFKYFGKSENE